MQQAQLGQYFYQTCSARAFEIMVRRLRRFQSLCERRGQRSVCGCHDGGRGNGNFGNNYCTRRVSFLQQGESNRTTPVPGIEKNNIDAECYYCHMTSNLSNNCPEVPFERRCNCGVCDRVSGGRTGTVMCHICVGLAQHDDGIIPSTWLLLINVTPLV